MNREFRLMIRAVIGCDWMGVSKDTFYDATKIAILPMSFCYPGHNRAGDLPPRRECAPAWRQQALQVLPNIQLTLVIGSYAIKWHLDVSAKTNLTETVKAWRSYAPEILPLPHPPAHGIISGCVRMAGLKRYCYPNFGA